MPFVFVVVGIGLVVIAIRGTQAQAFTLLQNEFAGPNSFIKWALALFILGGLGYVPVIRPITRALLLLVLLVIFLKNGTGLYASFNSQVANPTASGGSGTGATGTSGMGALSGLSPIQPIAGGGTSTNYLDNTSTLNSGASGNVNAGTSGTGANLVNNYDAAGNWIGMSDPNFVQ